MMSSGFTEDDETSNKQIREKKWRFGLTLAGHHEYPDSLAHITGASCISLGVSGGPSSNGLCATLGDLPSPPEAVGGVKA